MTPTLGDIRPEMTVGELPMFDHRISPETPTSDVADLFERNSNLVGVIVATDDELAGLLPRAAFLERLSQPFARELYIRRPIRSMYQAFLTNPDVLAANLLIQDAAHAALGRPKAEAFEPVVILDDDGGLRLLDVHTLLLAQSRLLELANEVVTKTLMQLAPRQKELRLRLMVNQTIVDAEGAEQFRLLREFLRPYGVYNNVVLAYDQSATYRSPPHRGGPHPRFPLPC